MAGKRLALLLLFLALPLFGQGDPGVVIYPAPGTAGASTAADVSVTPVGAVAATDVQAAIQELDSEKLATGGTAANTALVTVTDTTDSSSFIAMFDTATGNLAIRTDLGLTYDASTGILSATGFAGPLVGNVTGNVSGSAGSATGNAGTATALAANGTNCSAGNYPLGVDASGNVEDCTAVAGAVAPLTLTGSTDAVQLLVTGNATQTNSIFTAEQANGSDVFRVGNTNGVVIGDGTGVEVQVAVSAIRELSQTDPGGANMASHVYRTGKVILTNTGNPISLSAANAEIQWTGTGLKQASSGLITVTNTGAEYRDLGPSHVVFQGTAPAITGTCGTDPSLAGKDGAGKLTLGTGSPSSCTLTFNRAFANAPACVAGNETSGDAVKAASTTTTVVLTPGTGGAFVAGDVVSYVCMGF